MLAALHNRTYARLFTAQVLALIGTGLLTVALGLLAVEVAGDDAGIVMGTALTIRIIAFVTISPVMSALVNRLPRTTVLVGADAVRAAMALCLPFVTDPWQIYLLIFGLQAASATFTPAFQATIPQVLPDEDDYTAALSLSRLAYDLESLLSPALAAVLLTVMSYHNLFMGTALGFVASIALVIWARLPALSRCPGAFHGTVDARCPHLRPHSGTERPDGVQHVCCMRDRNGPGEYGRIGKNPSARR